MLVERGRVVGIDDDGLWVATEPTSICAKCSAKDKGCGQSLLVEAQQDNKVAVKAHFDKTNTGARSRIWQLGDTAEIGIAEHALLVGSLILYLLPLMSMIVGALLVSSLGAGDVYAVAGALLGLALGGVGVKWHAGSRRDSEFYQVRVL